MKKVLVIALVSMMVLGLMGGVVGANEDHKDAPAVAVKILQDNDIDFRYEDGSVEHPRHGTRILYSNYISMVARSKGDDAEFPAYDPYGNWDKETYIEKSDVEDYYWAVYNYLRFLGAELPKCGVLDPAQSGATFEDNSDGTGTLTITLVDHCGNPLLPDDFPIVPPTNTHDDLTRSWVTYFRANSDSIDNHYFYYIGGRHFNEDYPGSPGLSSTNASHVGVGEYEIILESLCGYDQNWEIGIGPWLHRDDVYVIEDEVEISIAPIQTCLLAAVYYGEGDLYGSHMGDTMTFTFSDDISRKENTNVTFETAERLWEGWGDPPMSWVITDNVLVVTATGVFNSPRDLVGDKVMNITGLEDSSGGDIVIPDGGVLITDQ